MRYLQNLFIILFLFIILLYSDAEYKVPLFILLIITNGLNTLYLTWTISKRKLNGQLVIEKNAPRTFYTKVVLLILFIVFSISISYDTKYIKYLNFSFLLFAFAFDEVDNYVKRKFKYNSLIIDNSTLIINGLFISKRDLKDLVKIHSIDLGDYLILTFKNSRRLTIERSHYKKGELWDFITKMISFSHDKVELTSGVLQKF